VLSNAYKKTIICQKSSKTGREQIEMITKKHLHQDNVVVLESNDPVLCISFQEDSREHPPHHQGDRPEIQ